MKINNVTLLGQAQKLEQNKSATKTFAEAPSASSAGPSAEAHLSQALRDSTRDIDTTRVAEIKDAIKDGRLQIDSEKIADRLIASVRGMLNKDGE